LNWPQRPTVLIVEDDASTAIVLVDVLSEHGYHTAHLATAAQAEAYLQQPGATPDLILLDLRLPDVDGLVLCATIRSHCAVPIIVCSATANKQDRVLALKLGADDFIAKPFDLDDFLARLAAVLRRAGPSRHPAAPTPPALEQVGDLVLSRERRRVKLGGVDVPLTPSEYRLLAGLMSRPDDVLTREELAQVMWGQSDAGTSRAIDVHIRRLRAKLGTYQVPAPPIVTVRGLGYRLVRDRAELSA
jgi:two-component system response regulator RegX3